MPRTVVLLFVHVECVHGKMRRSRNYSFVIFNPTDDDNSLLSCLECKYIVFAHGVGESGTHHYQGTVCFNNQKTLSAVSELLPRAHIDRTIDLAGSIRYCKKDGVYTERGIPPGTVRDVVTMDSIDGSFLWYHGPSRTANSCKARAENPGAYVKLPVEHWYNYNGQDVVIIEDWFLGLHGLISNLKQWADHYPFQAEINDGEFSLIRPKKIIITSNYTIDECFPCEQARQSMHRRFNEVYINE